MRKESSKPVSVGLEYQAVEIRLSRLISDQHIQEWERLFRFQFNCKLQTIGRNLQTVSKIG